MLMYDMSYWLLFVVLVFVCWLYVVVCCLCFVVECWLLVVGY